MCAVLQMVTADLTIAEADTCMNTHRHLWGVSQWVTPDDPRHEGVSDEHARCVAAVASGIR